MSAIFVNGVESRKIAADDRGLAYGDGVFRTMRVRGGVPLHWPRQFSKLASDCAALALAVPDERTLAVEIAAACSAPHEHAVKIIVTRGRGRRGYGYSGEQTPTRIVQAERFDLTRADERRAGVAVRLCTIRLSAQPALAGVKHLNRLENVLARAEWSDPNIAEGVLLDAGGGVICGTMSNLFVVHDGVLATPMLDRCGVAGVTRDRVIDAAKRHDIACAVKRLTVQDLERADEIFLVNSLFGLWPVRALDDAPRKTGLLSRTVQSWLDEEDDARVA